MEEDGLNSNKKKWCFKGNKTLSKASAVSVRGILGQLLSCLDKDDPRAPIPLGHGDPSNFPRFRTTPVAEDALIDAIRSGQFNCYSSTTGLLPARRAIAEYLSHELPYQLSPDDVYLTLGCQQAIEVIIHALTSPGANILLPRPGFPAYESICAYTGLEARHFNLIPENGWEVDLDSVEALADENTVAMVIVSPGNPCGNVFTYQHLQKVAGTARKLGILVIADEVYHTIAFGNKPFVPMGVFASIVPVVTLCSISKRWVVPGWRLGWIATNDTHGILEENGIIQSIKSYLDISPDPVTFIQGAIPQIIEHTKGDFFSKIIDIIREAADICYNKINEISCITCPNKPEGSMFVMVQLNLSMLEDISDDMDFCLKLAKEESVIVFPGFAVGMKNWLRITFGIEPSLLDEGLERIKAFGQRHAKKQ